MVNKPIPFPAPPTLFAAANSRGQRVFSDQLNSATTLLNGQIVDTNFAGQHKVPAAAPTTTEDSGPVVDSKFTQQLN